VTGALLTIFTDNPKGFTWLSAAILFAVGCLVYSNTLQVPFYFDDIQNIRDSKAIHITELSLKQLSSAVSDASSRNRPLANLSFALNYYFHQQLLPGYHFVNIGIHLLAALFLYLLLVTTFSLPTANVSGNPRLIALLAALLWLTHPIQTQSVTYIVQRMTSLAGMLYLVSLFCYAQGRIRQKEARRSLRWFCTAAVTGMLSLTAKENAVTLPFFILLYEFYFFRNLDRQWLKKTLPWLAAILTIIIVAGYLFTHGHPLQTITESYHYRDFSLGQRLLTESRVVFFYLSLLLYPHPSRLSLDHAFPLSHSLIQPLTTIPALGGLLLLLVIAVAVVKKERLLSFAILWFLGNLFLESSFLGLELVFEHRLYLPSMFILALLPMLAFRLKRLQTSLIAVIAIAIVLFSCWTYQRNDTWRDPITFHQDIVNKAPGKPRPHYNLGLALGNAGRFAEAIPELTRALELEPRLLMAHSRLAQAYSSISRDDLAIFHYNKVLAMTPNDPATLAAIGILYGKRGNLPMAKESFEKALLSTPDDAATLLNLGTVLHQQGDTEAALRLYQQSLQINPDNAKANSNLGFIYLSIQNYELAEKYLRQALKIDPSLANTQRALGNINRLRSKKP